MYIGRIDLIVLNFHLLHRLGVGLRRTRPCRRPCALELLALDPLRELLRRLDYVRDRIPLVDELLAALRTPQSPNEA